MHRRCGPIVSLAMLIALAGVVRQTEAGQRTAVAALTTVRCTFAQRAAGTWLKDGTVDAGVRAATLVLLFEAIDADTGTAQLRNGAMRSDVTVRQVEGYLHLVQAFRTGALYTTTVFDAGAAGGRFKAVHSRHEYFITPLDGATSSPEQYYGECEAGNASSAR